MLQSFSDDDEEAFNGAVEAIATLLGAVTVLGVQFVPLKWNKHWGNLAILVVSFVGGALLFWMSQTSSILVAYGGKNQTDQGLY